MQHVISRILGPSPSRRHVYRLILHVNRESKRMLAQANFESGYQYLLQRSRPPTRNVCPSAATCSALQQMSQQDMGLQMAKKGQKRVESAIGTLGYDAYEEACKGLSRSISTGDPADLELFGKQLRESDCNAVSGGVWSDDGTCVVAVSYVQSYGAGGRLKFSAQQWHDLRSFVGELRRAGVRRFRLWHDQCLWLRDASQRSWAHIGVLPYAVWPVLSLGTKRTSTADRTISSYERFWPFVEEIAALWGGGLFVTRELRSSKSWRSDSRRAYSYNCRSSLQPDEALEMVLHNVFHGAAENLATGWTEDVHELSEIARWNISYGSTPIVVGANWKTKLGMKRADARKMVHKLVLPGYGVNQRDASVKYIDGSRRVPNDTRCFGISSFFSGNTLDYSTSCPELMQVFHSVDWYKLTLNRWREIQLLRLTDTSASDLPASTFSSNSLWLLVRMNRVSTGSKFGGVAWTKIVHGKRSCLLQRAIERKNMSIVKEVLAEQLGEDTSRIEINKITKMNPTPRPTWTRVFS